MCIRDSRFIRQWTAQSPTMLQTDSLRAFLAGATERQAGDLLAHVRALVADEKRAILEADLTNAREEPF